ncbi:hypothetical protein GIB67_019481 [Kingdonia uniflora]|uniref:Uncharacterized protein n=1 Tax=Kingdonia uniflora TaxID=39325 RepID=A0A7J7N019_9MAGN|nr:hypothetical protein GIB67_019481 [Kingdonia uniflora]
MEAQDDVWQAFVSSLVLTDDGDALSPEEAFWVDSCLVEDPELSDSSWNAVRDTLLDVLIAQPTLRQETVFAQNKFDLEFDPMSEEAGSTQIFKEIAENQISERAKTSGSLFSNQLHRGFLSKSPDHEEDDYTCSDSNLLGDFDPMNEDTETTHNLNDIDEESFVTVTKKTKSSGSQLGNHLRKRFLSTSRDHEEDEKNSISFDLGAVTDLGPLPENIFRIWDLDTGVLDKDETFTQFEKDFAGLEIDSLDGLISCMGDLSLHPT